MTDIADHDPIWRRIGFATKNCCERIESMEKYLEDWGRYNDVYGPTSPDNPTYESYTGRSDDLFTSYQLIQLIHLGIAHPFGPSRAIVETASALGVDLFCGSWRDHALLHSGQVLDRDQCRKEFDVWFDELRIALFFAFLKQDPQQAEQVAGYIGDDLYPCDGYWDRVENDRLVYWLICEFVGKNQAPQDAAEKIEKGRPKRPKLMLALLRAIQQNDAAAFEKPFRDLVKHFKANELKGGKRDINTIRIVTSIDASLIWNLASFSGLEVAMPAGDAADYVITRESVAYGHGG